MADTAAELDTFLKRDAPEPEPTPEPAPEPKADAAEGGEKQPPDTAQTEPDDDGETDEDGPFLEDTANFRKLREFAKATRKERQDWKRQAVEAQTQRDELRKQLEEAKRTPVAQPAAPPEPPQPRASQMEAPNPVADPVAFANWAAAVAAERTEAAAYTAQMHGHLNQSERALRREIGKEAVDALIVEAKAVFEESPSLHREFIQQDDPYGWLNEKVKAVRIMREVTTDPDAYKAKLRAEWEAEAAASIPAPRVSPAAGMAPSLATVRSVAGRSAPAFTGPTPLGDILARRPGLK